MYTVFNWYLMENTVENVLDINKNAKNKQKYKKIANPILKINGISNDKIPDITTNRLIKAMLTIK